MSAPDDLFALENITFDHLLGTARWVGKPQDIAGPWCKLSDEAEHSPAK